MKKRTRILALSLALVLGLGTAAAAAGDLLNISVTPGIKVLINGEPFAPKDVNGKDVPIFAYQGTTYAPVRGLAESFGLEVGYDAAQQAAVVTGASGSDLKAPYDPRTVEYVLSVPPETYVDDNGEEQISYNDVEFDFLWRGYEKSGLKLKLVSGALPEGIELDGTVIKGRAMGEVETDVVYNVQGKRDGEAVNEDVTLRFAFLEGGTFNTAPVVIWGVEGDGVHEYVKSFYNGILYTGDDLFRDPASEVRALKWGSSPIGSQAGLDELAKHGLSMNFETQGDDGFYWADNFVEGTLTGATNGWVKISVPAYAGMGSTVVDGDGNLSLNGWWVSGEGADGNPNIVYGNVDIYLNILSF